MALEARRQISRRSWLLAGLAIPVFRAKAAPQLNIIWDGDNLRVSAPELHFLTGKPLQRLKDGLSVVFLSQLTIFTDNLATVFRRVPERLVVSYDLWEEKFSVTCLGATRRSRSNLTAASAEVWAVENLWVATSGLAPDRQFSVRLELRVADPKEVGSVVGDAGISISRLVEIFSRRPSGQDLYWSADSSPLRLADLKRVPGRHG